MRSVWFGLVGAVLAFGGAQAAECRLDELEMVAEANTRPAYDEFGVRNVIARPDLVGKTFKVTKAASDFWRAKHGAPGDLRDDGSIFAVVQSGPETFVVSQVYNGNAGPQEMGYSFPLGSKSAPKVEWSRRSAQAERERFGGFFDIYDGPLNGLVLKAQHCS